MEYSESSLIGHREDNQDRAAVVADDHAALLAVIDGMGGHAEGALAAEAALKSLVESFKKTTHPLIDPLGFLHLALGQAHEQVVALGTQLAVDARPRATCAVCLVQHGSAYWAHVGDSRIYHIRGGSPRERTRDHSHVEQLLREGAITEEEIQAHPMRNFVECCLGGEAMIPEMTISPRRALAPEDILLLCTDGVWANLRDPDIAGFYDKASAPKDFQGALANLCKRAVSASAPYSDNATAAALRFVAPE